MQKEIRTWCCSGKLQCTDGREEPCLCPAQTPQRGPWRQDCGEGTLAICSVVGEWEQESGREPPPPRGERGRLSLSLAQDSDRCAPPGLPAAPPGCPAANRGGVLRPHESAGSRAAGCPQRGRKADVEVQGTGAWWAGRKGPQAVPLGFQDSLCCGQVQVASRVHCLGSHGWAWKSPFPPLAGSFSEASPPEASPVYPIQSTAKSGRGGPTSQAGAGQGGRLLQALPTWHTQPTVSRSPYAGLLEVTAEVSSEPGPEARGAHSCVT